MSDVKSIVDRNNVVVQTEYSHMYNIKRYNRQRSGKGAIRKRFPLQKPRWEKPNQQSGTDTKKTFRKPNEQLFSQ